MNAKMKEYSGKGRREREAKKRNDVTVLVTRSHQVNSWEQQQENDAFAEEENFDDLTLDIVIEGAVILPVFLQEAKSIMVAEVFKLDEGARTVPERSQSEDNEQLGFDQALSLETCIHSLSDNWIKSEQTHFNDTPLTVWPHDA